MSNYKANGTTSDDNNNTMSRKRFAIIHELNRSSFGVMPRQMKIMVQMENIKSHITERRDHGEANEIFEIILFLVSNSVLQR